MATGEGQDPNTNNPAGPGEGATPPSEPAAEPTQADGLDLDAALKVIDDLRKENAKKRKDNKALKEKADKLDQIEAANMSAQEKLEKELADLRAANAQALDRANRAELVAMGMDPKTAAIIDLNTIDFSDQDALKESLSHLFEPPKRKAESTPPHGKQTPAAWDMDRIKTASRSELLENMEAVRAAIGGGSGTKERL